MVKLPASKEIVTSEPLFPRIWQRYVRSHL